MRQIMPQWFTYRLMVSCLVSASPCEGLDRSPYALASITASKSGFAFMMIAFHPESASFYSRLHPALHPCLELFHLAIAPWPITRHVTVGKPGVDVLSVFSHVLIGRQIDPVRFHGIDVRIAEERPNIGGKAQRTHNNPLFAFIWLIRKWRDRWDRLILSC